MEYRKRRRIGYRPKHAGGYPAYFAAAAVFVGIVYCIAASRVGTWMAENWIAPALMKSADRSVVEQPEAEQAQQRESETEPAEPAEASARAAQRCSLPAYACYALQMGAYEDAEHAGAQSAALKKLGAAGSIVSDGTKQRVLAAGYPNRDDAETVIRQLSAEGVDACLYTFACAEATFTVTGSDAQMQTFSDALAALTPLMDAIQSAAIAFDRDGQSVQQGAAAAQGIQAQCAKQQRALLTLVTDAGESVKALGVCYDRIAEAAARIAAKTDAETAAFSSELKGLYLLAVEARAALTG